MKGLRTAFGLIVMGMLVLGYAASQSAFFSQTTAEYAAKIDVPQVKWLSLGVVALLVVLAIWEPRADEGGQV